MAKSLIFKPSLNIVTILLIDLLAKTLKRFHMVIILFIHSVRDILIRPSARVLFHIDNGDDGLDWTSMGAKIDMLRRKGKHANRLHFVVIFNEHGWYDNINKCTKQS
jgi:hypothetical protein